MFNQFPVAQGFSAGRLLVRCKVQDARFATGQLLVFASPRGTVRFKITDQRQLYRMPSVACLSTYFRNYPVNEIVRLTYRRRRVTIPAPFTRRADAAIREI